MTADPPVATAAPPSAPPADATPRAPVARPAVVRFENVAKVYGEGTVREATAIRDVTFVVEDREDKGEIVCMLGPSGCGKSTILRIIAGLAPQFPPTRGKVEIFGGPILGPGADRGMVFQSYTAFDHRSVLENISFGLECRGVSRREREAEARRWIEKVGLSVARDASKFPHELSGGMQQRVAIARTLILKPRIILMDEPFGALDPLMRLQMQDLLIELWREQQATIFFVTHSIEEAVFLGDRAYLVSPAPGRILKEVPLPPPDRPAMEMHRDAAFQERVFQLREDVHKLESKQSHG
ncbi:MAG: ABC transporter ATP-binding protein [Deltaproteobacteria bacterium]|nr:ABC transporter ATP-binding protein [Deltaproteobacteria bacterium]